MPGWFWKGSILGSLLIVLAACVSGTSSASSVPAPWDSVTVACDGHGNLIFKDYRSGNLAFIKDEGDCSGVPAWQPPNPGY
jgi:hypothetical protein